MMSAAAVIAAGATCGPLALSATAAPSAPAGNPLVRLTADQIAKKAATDLKAAASFHYHGSGKASGQTVSISMSVTHKGCTGWIGDGRNGGFAILAIGKTVWIQPNDKFWEYVGVPASQLSAVHGEWLETTGTSSGWESIYVSISSKPEILRISDNGTINFSAYGARVTLTPPPASDVIKLSGASLRAHSLQDLLRGM